ncbi:hypothetical protein FACS189481_1980 [Clostridia bacterium]|nr:hypothetical protein FACS189481_1980 [Clostridia bacterium]
MIKVKKYLALFLIVVCSVFFSGCPKIDLGVETKMSPPILSAEQVELKAVLKKYVKQSKGAEEQEPELIYPRSGDYLMPYIEYLTDGKRSIFVLFSFKTKEIKPNEREKETVKIGIYKKTKDSWQIADCADISSTDGVRVEEISFHQMKNDANKNILVSYSVLGKTEEERTEKKIAIYEYDGTSIKKVEGGSFSYFDKIEADIDDDGCIEIIYVDRPKKTYIPRIKIAKLMGSSFPKPYQMLLKPEIDPGNQDIKHSNMIIDRFNDNTPVIFVNERVHDEKLKSQMMITEVIEYRNGSLINKTYKENQKSGEKGFDRSLLTRRDERIGLRDVDDDGCLEIPMEIHSDNQPNEEKDLKLIEWNSFQGDEPELRAKTLENLATPYRLKLPEKWWSIAREEPKSEKGTEPKKNTETKKNIGAKVLYKFAKNTLTITEAETKNTEAKTKKELLAIKVLGVGKKLTENTYEKFGETKDYVYFVRISNEADAMGINMDELRELLKIGVMER